MMRTTSTADITMSDAVANGVSGVIFTFLDPGPLAWARIHMAGRAWLDDDILWVTDDEASDTGEMFEDEGYKVLYLHDMERFTMMGIEREARRKQAEEESKGASNPNPSKLSRFLWFRRR